MVCSLSDESALLGSYPVDSGMRLHVKDTSGKASAFDDEMLSKVEKFELSQEQVSKPTICTPFNAWMIVNLKQGLYQPRLKAIYQSPLYKSVTKVL